MAKTRSVASYIPNKRSEVRSEISNFRLLGIRSETNINPIADRSDLGPIASSNEYHLSDAIPTQHGQMCLLYYIIVHLDMLTFLLTQTLCMLISGMVGGEEIFQFTIEDLKLKKLN